MMIPTRIGTVRRTLHDTGLDAILVTNPANRRYLSGFTADDHAADESAGLMFISPHEAVLIVSPTNLPWARAEASSAVAVEHFESSYMATIAAKAHAGDIRRLGVEDRTTTASFWFALRDELDGETALVPAADAIDRLRAIKDAGELGFLREAARLTDAAFALATDRITVGLTEAEAADIVRDALREVGSEGEAFDTIVAAGPNAARPHHRPGDHAIQPGEPVIIDMAARVNGYNGDLTRTFCFGTPGAELVTVYNLVLEAQLAGLKAIRAGEPAAAPDLATREVFARHGQEHHVIHSAGHGLGLRVHEAPSVRKTSDATLAAGNVVTMEPGLYIAGWGGVRIEDVAIVRGDEHENITSAPKGLGALAR